MKMIIIGERFNMPEHRAWHQRAWDDHDWWVKVSLRAGAFNLPRDRDKFRLLGVEPDHCDSMNIVPPAPQGVPFDHLLARSIAQGVDWARWSIIIACGRHVQRALGVRRVEPGSLVGRALAVPHPSGLNRFWNDGAWVAEVSRAVQGHLRDVSRCPTRTGVVSIPPAGRTA